MKMIERFRYWIGGTRPSSQRLLHQELQAIELQLVNRNEEIVTLYKEMEQLRARKDVVNLKLDQWRRRPLKSFRMASPNAS